MFYRSWFRPAPTGRRASCSPGRRPRPRVANDRLRYMLIGYARVSEADGSRRGTGRAESFAPSRNQAVQALCAVSASRRPGGGRSRRPGVCAPVFSASYARNRPGNGPRSLAKSECATGQILSGFRSGSARVSCEVTRTGLTWARSTFRTDARRSVLFDTSTTPETPGSWSTAAIGRGRR